MASKAILVAALMLCCASAALATDYQCNDDSACKASSPCQYGKCSYGKCVYKQRPEGYKCALAYASPCQYGKCSYGNCVATPRPDGYRCSDGNACTSGDKCYGGECKPGKPKKCRSKDQCKTSACNKATGKCEEASKPEGAPCNDGKKCTHHDKCTYGVCQGKYIDCPTTKQCTKASCNPLTGKCKTDTLPDGTPCDDGDYNTYNDKCTYGSCKGTPKYG